MIRKIIHIDMDAFYASVEQRDRPELRGRPVIVGGDPERRGVVAACSYEARAFGVHSAMPGRTALRRCPQAVFLRPRFEVYRTVSEQIREIFQSVTDLVEPLSLDEAFLDVTENQLGLTSATRVAQWIRRRIVAETALTASAGVSYNKFLAKVASAANKPDGLTVITPREAPGFIDRLPIRKFFGVGEATERRMIALGIRQGADLKRFSRSDLIRLFGKAGGYFHDIAHGQDDRPVVPDRERKSIGREITLDRDVGDPEEMIRVLEAVASDLAGRLRKRGVSGYTVTLKVKYADFQTVTRAVAREIPVSTAAGLMAAVTPALRTLVAGEARKARLLGIYLSRFVEPGAPARPRQLLLPLFPEIVPIP